MMLLARPSDSRIYAGAILLVIRSRIPARRFGRALAALIVMVGVLFAPIELLLPDAHDGDASATVNDGSWTTHGPAAGIALSAPADGDSQGDQHHPLQPPVHATHVDHCAHAHLLTLVVSPRLTPAPPPSPDLFELGRSRPASITLAPHLRPPIA